MAGSAPSCQPRALVADNTFAPSLPKKVLGAALGVVAAMPLLAPSPAQALTSCASASAPLGTGDSCTIDYGGPTYDISLKTDTFTNAFPSPSTTNMFWWNNTTAAVAAVSSVGAAFGTPNSLLPAYAALGPYFAYEMNSFTVTAASNATGLVGTLGSTHLLSSSRVWATSSVYAPSGGGGNSASVPGPLPILGLAAAFGFSRKLRKRIKLQKVTSDISTSAVK